MTQTAWPLERKLRKFLLLCGDSASRKRVGIWGGGISLKPSHDVNWAHAGLQQGEGFFLLNVSRASVARLTPPGVAGKPNSLWRLCCWVSNIRAAELL